ncbi:MAG: DUF4350 domain-containing protein [Bacteroidota bacterium]
MIRLLRRHTILMIVFGLICGGNLLPAQTSSLHFSLTNGLGKRGVTYAYPVFLNDSLTAADSLLAGEFTIVHNGTVFDVVGIQKTGSLLDSATCLFNAATGKITFAHTKPITGKGLFLDLLITIKAGASGTTTTSLQNFLLNEGSITAIVASGSMRPMDIFITPKNPPQDRIVGDTVQFTVTGDVHMPVTWAVADTHIASIDINGRVIGKNVGQTTVSISDNLGLTDQSNLLPFHPASLRSLTVSITDTSVMQNLTFNLPVRISSVTGLGITSAQFRLNFNSSLLIPLGVVQNGTLSQAWGTPEVSLTASYINVAMAGATALQDSGTFVFVQFKVKRFANFSDWMTLTNVLFNENLNANLQSGRFTPIIGPIITIAGKPSTFIRNETANLIASGGTSPYRWKLLSDTSIALLDTITGTLFAKTSGYAAYSATDVNGFDGIDSVLVHDVRFTMPDTTIVAKDSIDYPISVSSLTGQSIIAAQFTVHYDTTKLQFIGVSTAGTVANGAEVQQKDSAGLRVALSTPTPFTGKGTFIKLRFKAKNNGVQPITLSQMILNETGFTNRTFVQNTGHLTVVAANTAPVFTAKIPSTTISENSLYQFQVQAADADGDSLLFGIFSGSPGMTMTGKGQFSWKPGFAQSGNHKVVYDVGDYHPDGVVRDSAVITVINVNQPPQFVKLVNDTTVSEDQLLTLDADAVDPDGDVVRYYISTIQPGMTVDSINGTITWKPTFTQSGVYPLILIAKDGKGGFAEDSIKFTVINVNRAPVFTTSMPETTVIPAAQTYSKIFTASDPDNDQLTFGFVQHPAGASIDMNTGLFTWMPIADQAGPQDIIISVTDNIATAVDTIHFRVLINNTPPTITTSLPDTVIAEGETLTFTYKASDAENDSLTWKLGPNIPKGVAITGEGVLSWSPDFSQSGKFTIIVSVQDKQFSVFDTALVTVANTNHAPRFTTVLPDTIIELDSIFIFTYRGTDEDSDAVSFSLIQKPEGAVISTAGVFSWTPIAVQRETLIVALSDGIVSVLDTTVISVSGFPKLVSSVTELDFGTTVYGSRPTQNALLQNVGRVPLILNRVTGLPNEQHFTMGFPDSLNISAGQTINIPITYTPQQIGSHSSGIAFRTNDPAHEYFGFAVKGTAISVAPLKRRLLVDGTHRSTVPLNDSLGGMTQLFGALRNSGITVTVAETSLAPSGYDAVLIVTPQKEFSVEEKEALRSFVRNGGLAVMMGNASTESGNSVLQDILRDSLLSGGMALADTLVLDSSHTYAGNPAFIQVTQFADTAHPYLRGVDTLVLFGATIVLTDSASVPFVTISSPTVTVPVPGKSNAAIGMAKVGNGTVVLLSDATLWQNSAAFDLQQPVNISANDNFTFALNVFSVTEHYEAKMPEKTPNEVYQLISIPFDLENLDILSVLKNSLGEINPLKWRLFGKYDPVAKKYREFPSAGFTSFARGEAYWLITRGEFNLNFGTATILPAQDYYSIRIGPGYSMIGNPFPYRVSWKNSRIGDSVQTVLWRFDPHINDFVSETSALEPFVGYFVKNLSTDSVTIFINPTSDGLGKQDGSSQTVEYEWQVKVKASSGKAMDAENIAGVSPNARVELDRLDVAEPPTTPTDYITVRFTNPGWSRHAGSYAVDIRPANPDGIVWEFDVTSAKAQAKVQLSFDRGGDFPGNFSLYLVDGVQEQVIRMDKAFQYEFTMQKSEKRRAFRLLAGTQEFIEQHTNGIPLVAIEYELQQNFPNPFNPNTFIHYSIGHSGTVQLEIFNVLGQKVRQLKNENQAIGSYTAEWDGKDDEGQAVASGVYFYKVTVLNNGDKLFANTKKMILMR